MLEEVRFKQCAWSWNVGAHGSAAHRWETVVEEALEALEAAKAGRTGLEQHITELSARVKGWDGLIEGVAEVSAGG